MGEWREEKWVCVACETCKERESHTIACKAPTHTNAVRNDRSCSGSREERCQRRGAGGVGREGCWARNCARHVTKMGQPHRRGGVKVVATARMDCSVPWRERLAHRRAGSIAASWDRKSTKERSGCGFFREETTSDPEPRNRHNRHKP